MVYGDFCPTLFAGVLEDQVLQGGGMQIGFDLDGVLCNLVDPWLMCLAVRKGIVIPSKIEMGSYEIEKNLVELGFDVNREDVLDSLDFTTMQINLLKPYDNASKAFEQALFTYGRLPIIMTARQLKHKDVTRAWVERWINIKGIEILHVPAVEKADYAKMIGINAFVEDKLETAEAMAQAGITSFLVSRPWNEAYLNGSGVIRVRGITDIFEYL